MKIRLNKAWFHILPTKPPLNHRTELSFVSTWEGGGGGMVIVVTMTTTMVATDGNGGDDVGGGK